MCIYIYIHAIYIYNVNTVYISIIHKICGSSSSFRSNASSPDRLPGVHQDEAWNAKAVSPFSPPNSCDHLKL